MERLPESQVALDIAADEDEFERAMERAYRKVGAQLAVPGFRKGKAPRAIIERMYGRGVFLEEAQKELMEDLYRRAIQQEELAPVGEPEVEITALEPLGFRVTVPVYPTVEPGEYLGVRVEPVDAAIDEAQVDEVIERLRKSQSPWVDPADEGMEVGPDLVLRPKVRTPREGDQVTIDLAVRENGEPFQEPVEDAVFILGESNLFARLREEIERLRPEETARFEMTFAEDDETVNPEVGGKTLQYEVTLKGIKERELLPLDDEFARTVGETDTLEELRREIREDLHQGRTAEARTSVVNGIINAMAERATIEPPAVMVDEAVEDDLQGFRQQLAQGRRTLEEYLRVNGQTEEELRAELRPAAARRLRNSLLLREIAEREGITVADADVDAEVERLVGAAEEGPNAERARQLYGSDYFRRVMRNDLFERRVTDRLIEIGTEGRGAVLNGWVEPEPEPEPEQTATAEGEAGGDEEAVADATAEAQSRSGDVATASDVEPDPTETVAEAAAEDPSAASVAPLEPVAGPGEDAGAAGAPGAGQAASDEALTLGTMPGQPGNVAATATTGGADDAVVRASEVAGEPDAAQAAAVGHGVENAAVAAEAPGDAVTPDEREALGPAGPGWDLPNPTY